MEHISNALKAIFSILDGDDVLYKLGLIKKYGKDGKRKYYHAPYHLDVDMEESEVMRLLKAANVYSTLDQQAIVGQVILSKWMGPMNNYAQLKSFDYSVFNILLYFGHKTLLIKDDDPVCRYYQLLRWHTVTSLLGEDIITTSFLASADHVAGVDRNNFDWAAYIEHDNKELNILLDRPLADLHMHLKGSSYNFDISWLSIMNNIEKLAGNFEAVYDKRKNADWDDELYDKLGRASAIRFYLASKVGLLSTDMTSANLSYLLEPLLPEEHNERVPLLKEGVEYFVLSEKISREKEYLQVNSRNYYQHIDYIPFDIVEKNGINGILGPERKLMYYVFRYILNKDTGYEDVATLFYAYLCYKMQFRKSIIQLNDIVGFRNFSEYQDLKDSFITSEYTRILHKAAIEPFLCKNTERYLETRIAPKDTMGDIRHKIEEIRNDIDDKYNKQYNLIFHFIKARDNRADTRYRHKYFREQLKNQAFAIYKFRNDDSNWGQNPLAGSLVGIDAANTELYCRPEVFAQTFRFLKGHKIRNFSAGRPNDLNVTFHVGEDFFDIADGLRAIEEAIIFLNLGNGDRLGHCLALGTDVRKYYSSRYHTICATKQVLLDNMAWLHHKCTKSSGYTSLALYLENIFHQYFREVYGDGIFTYESLYDENYDYIRTLDNVHDYYHSWLLRGNSPTFGSDEDIDSEDQIEKEWLNASLNHHIGPELARKNKNALDLHELYHKDCYVNQGADAVTFTIRREFREDFYNLLELIQEQLLVKIERKRIAIECNPSSNYKIGEFGRYDEHPITRFNNAGLNTPYSRHDISVSINTDDQGVFATSLEREYSLIALAMERNQIEGYYNSPRQIIDWLDKIRQMSIEQQFSK